MSTETAVLNLSDHYIQPDRIEDIGSTEFRYFSNFVTPPIAWWSDLIISGSLLAFGLALNILILFYYFRDGSGTGRYIRVLALYDCFMLVVQSGLRFTRLFIKSYHPIQDVFFALFLFGGAYALIGPLFLALDRFLIVAFPFTFPLHQNKMRAIKMGILALVTCNSLAYIATRLLVEFLAFTTAAFAILEIVTCVVLYMIIVIKIVRSERKMNNSRHVGNG